MSADQNPGSDDCGAMAFREPRLKTILRRLLGAYGRHRDIANPCDVVLQMGISESQGIGQPPKIVKPHIVAQDAIIVRTEITLGWKDWFRVLFGCKLQVNSVVYCQHQPGATHTEVEVFAVLL